MEQHSRPKVVVIEDEQILRDLIQEELEKREYAVSVAIDGDKGWQLIEKVKPDIILLDLLMPVMNGYEVLTKLRESETFRETPCIVISNSGQTADLSRAYALGANDVLIKAEFNPDQVVEKVAQLLEKKSTESLLPQAADMPTE
jgi:CheY-like chemotaxis protein